MSGSQDAQAAEQIANGTSTESQDGSDGQEDESMMGRLSERRCQGVEEGPRWLGQSLMDAGEVTTALAGFLGLLPSQSSKLFLELFLGQARARPTDYSRHSSLLCESQDLAYTCHLTKEAALQKTSKKGQKWN
jgi:hypothetical protein